MIFNNEKAFTLIELVVSLMLSAIIVFFSYTMMTTSYKMFSGLHRTSYNLNNTRFFEEAMRRSIASARWNDVYNHTSYNKPIEFISSDRRLVVRRFDSVKGWVKDTYYFSNNAQFKKDVSNNYDTRPENIKTLSPGTNLMLNVEKEGTGEGTDILLLRNVRACYYRKNRITGTGTEDNLMNITFGIVYDDDSSKVMKRKNKSFCFTIRSIGKDDF
ncbi:MAG: prepilin-type N-terminal cleavage/methylation domain-containing protein [Elusimicrobia bacterium]|nr:prepilin-type N-terminal cleavage/methylation domain-containing protein [Elusimicrobiota bacterium]